jgi:general secretion pathway protein D
MMKKIVLSFILIGSLASVTLQAKDAHFRETNRNEVNINFKDLKIVDFIKMVAKITGKNILISQNITGTVDYVSVKPIKKNQIFTLLKDILASKGYTLRDTRNGFLKVIKSADASKSSPPMYGDSDIAEVQTTVIPIYNLNVRTILRQINFLLSRYGKISLSNENNSIVVTDFPSNIVSIENVIAKLDQDQNTKVQFVTLYNAQAKSVYSKVKQLSSALFNNKIATQKVDVFSDDASNSIILVGNRENVRVLIPYIKKMDKADKTVDKRMEILYVKNADATEIVKTLEKLLSDKSFAKSPVTNASPKTVTTKIPQKAKNGKVLPPIVKTETITPSIVGDKDKPTVTVDAELNAIIVYATENELKEIRSVVNSLDTERQQVYVMAKIIEISDKKGQELGAKYEILSGIAGGAGLYGISAKLMEGSLSPLTTLASFTGADSKLGNIPNVSKALGMGITLALLDSNGVTSVLSEPSILCINNKESSIYVGQTESILTQKTLSAASAGLPTESYSREDIGLTLKVKPRISADNKVSLEVSVVSEDVEQNAKSLTAQPTTTKREVTTSSIVMNGETVIIGGLIKDNSSDTVSKVPLLGDIPILGIPFRYTKTNHDKRSLVIMLTPYIVKKSEDLAQLRDALGKLSVLSHDIADKFETEYLEGQVAEDNAVINETPAVEAVTHTEILIDDFGNSYEVILDEQGREISRRQVQSPF